MVHGEHGELLLVEVEGGEGVVAAVGTWQPETVKQPICTHSSVNLSVAQEPAVVAPPNMLSAFGSSFDTSLP